MSEKELMSVSANDGRLLVYDDYVYFERKSVMGHLDSIFRNYDKDYYNEKRIPYDMINGIEWNKASMIRNGYITLAVEGEIKSATGLKGATKNATSIVFYPKANDDASKCVEFISKKIKECKKQTIEVENKSSFSSTDELIKFKQMLDNGIITEEEFVKIKEKIIGKL